MGRFLRGGWFFVFITTILGMKHPEMKKVFLFGDRQETALVSKTREIIEIRECRKLRKGSSGEYCFGFAGNMEERSLDFFDRFADGDFDLEEIISKKYFSGLRDLNINNMADGKSKNNMLFASRLGGILLSFMFALGLEKLER